MLHEEVEELTSSSGRRWWNSGDGETSRMECMSRMTCWCWTRREDLEAQRGSSTEQHNTW